MGEESASKIAAVINEMEARADYFEEAGLNYDAARELRNYARSLRKNPRVSVIDEMLSQADYIAMQGLDYETVEELRKYALKLGKAR